MVGGALKMASSEDLDLRMSKGVLPLYEKCRRSSATTSM